MNADIQSSSKEQAILRPMVMFPLIFFQLFMAITVFIFVFGPIHYPLHNPLLFFLFLLGAQVALGVGYLTGIHSRPSRYHSKMDLERFLKASLIAGAVWAIPSMIIRTATIREMFGGLLNCFVLGLVNPGEVYNQHQIIMALRTTGEIESLIPNSISLIDTLLSPLIGMALPFGILMWRKLNYGLRAMFFFINVMYVASWIAIGTNKGLFDMVLIVPWCIIAAKLRAGDSLASAVRRLGLVGGAMLLMGSLYFSIAAEGRRIDRGVDPGTMLGEVDANSVFLMLPDRAARTAIHLTGYLSQGYYALDLALDEPFVPCFGFGNSYFLAGLSGPLFGRGVILERSYPGRIEAGSGWSLWQKWHTFYVWMASDVTFPGVLVVVGLVGRLLATVWIDTVFGRNAYAIGLFPLVILMVFYFPANNQILGFSTTAIPFVALTGMWIYSRLRSFASDRAEQVE